MFFGGGVVHYLGHVEGFAWGGWDGEFVFFLRIA